MNEHRDTEFSHGYLNYLFSLQQGKVAALNMLLQFGLASEEEIQQVKASLDRVSNWLRDLWNGVCILSVEWKVPNTYESKELLSDLTEIQEELRLLRDDMAAVFSMPLSPPLDPQVRSLLIAALGRAAYSKDNYLRGIKKLADFCNRKEASDAAERALREHESEVQFAHSFFKEASSANEISAELDETLLRESGVLRGKFGCQVHDLSQMIAHFEGGFSYEKSEIPFEEQADWKRFGAPALEAGYWHAYGFSAAESMSWRQLGLRDHNIAGAWVALRFTPASAAPWHFSGFHPRRAYEWAIKNFIPEQALELVRLGFRSPLAVPNDVEERVRKEIDKPFGMEDQQPSSSDSEHDYWKNSAEDVATSVTDPLSQTHDDDSRSAINTADDEQPA